MELQALFLPLTYMLLSGTGEAVPSPATRSSVLKTRLQPSPGHSSPPQPPEKTQPRDMFHPFQQLDILQTDNVDLAQKLLQKDFGPVFSIDGIPMEKLPRTFWKAAVLSEMLGSRGGVGGLSILPAPPERGEDDEGESMEQDDMTASAYCTTDECVQMMKEYEEWRAKNGYGTVGGRWG